MKLHEIQTSDPDACSDPVWELIPWYVNKSLPEDEAAALRLHAEGCAFCTAEIRRQQVLAKDVVTSDPFDVPLAQSWETLRRQIDAETRARKPQAQGLRGFLRGQRGIITAIGTVSLACLVLVIGLDTPQGDGFQTLTSAPDTAGPVVKFQAMPGTSSEMLEAVLAAQGATLASGPTDQGIYTATFAEGSNIRDAADALMATPQILFAAPETE